MDINIRGIVDVAKRYSVLATLEAALGASIAASTIAVYLLSPNSLKDASLSVVIAGFGAVAVLYFFSVHQFLKKKYLKTSTIVLSLITAGSILTVIQATGGLDSPYYSMWLLAIVVAGFFGVGATVTAIGITTLYVAYSVTVSNVSYDYFVAHLGILIMSLGTAVVSEWVHRTIGDRDGEQHAAIAHLSGKLTAESLKSEAIMQRVGEGVLVVNTKRQIQLFNPAAVRLTGWDQNSSQGIDYRLVLNLRDASGNKLSDATDPMVKMWNTGKNLVSTDLTMETKGGRKVAVSLSLSPITDSAGQISGAIALFRDISAEKEVERQRSEFISTASHEMRTPVAAIEGYLSLAMNASVATIDDRAKGYLDKAHNATQHLGELFRDLLSVTKLEDSHLAGEEYFDLTQLVSDAVADMKFEAQKKGLDLQFGGSEQDLRGDHTVIPVYAVKANPQRIREVVMNLIENGLKFTAEGGVHVSVSGNNESVTVSVTDTGIGISGEDISHLFQKFYRVDSTATRTIGGTGLGLYLCRSIIEHSGGKIWVESKLSQGSSFKFTLPRLPSDSLQKKPLSAPAVTTPMPTQAEAKPELPPAPSPVPTPQPAPAPVPITPPTPTASDKKLVRL